MRACSLVGPNPCLPPWQVRRVVAGACLIRKSRLAPFSARGYNAHAGIASLAVTRALDMPRWTFGILLVAAAFLALGGYKMFMTSSTRAEPPAFTATAAEGFAADRAPAEPVRFDAKRAMSYLEQICKIGPRMSATEGMQKQQEMLKKHFEVLGVRVHFQKFTARQASRGQEVEMA